MKITPFGVAVVNGDSHLSTWVEEHGKLDVDGSAHEMAEKFIKAGDTVIDAGACLGDHTIVYLNKVGPTGVVHAFEPNPIAFECLAHNCPTAVLHREALGIGHWRGDVSMGETHEDPPHSNLGAATIVMVPGGIVRVVPLDAFNFTKVNFIKLDIEGMELDALKGAKHTLSALRPTVMVEINPRILAGRGVVAEDVFRFMDSLGYKHELLDPRYGLEQEHTNIIFSPK